MKSYTTLAMKSMASLFVLFLFAPCLSAAELKEGETANYVIVVSEPTKAAWPDVVRALEKKYKGAATITFADKLDEVLPELRKHHPRHTCFVARHPEVTRSFVAAVHRLTRRLDKDPYTDTQWGILTGFDQANALAIARHADELTIRKVASGTEVELDLCEEGLWYCELKKGHMVRKKAGAEPKAAEGPADTTRALADTLTDYKADLFITSGHATERNWQIGFRYKNGYFRSKDGQLFGTDTGGDRFDISNDSPRVYMPIGNCLMGHIDGPDAMALAWMNSAGVKQMLGYTVPTWFGYQGWGVLDYFVEQPGRYTFTEAFFANHHALIHKLKTKHPELLAKNPPPGKTTTYNEPGGLLFDRDVVAFYGDPAWRASMAASPKRLPAYGQKLTEKDGVYTFVITPNRGSDSFKPVNTNGAQRGLRPVVQWLPQRVGEVELLEGAELKPEITDDFILIPHDGSFDLEREYKVVFRAAPIAR